MSAWGRGRAGTGGPTGSVHPLRPPHPSPASGHSDQGLDRRFPGDVPACAPDSPGPALLLAPLGGAPSLTPCSQPLPPSPPRPRADRRGAGPQCMAVPPSPGGPHPGAVSADPGGRRACPGRGPGAGPAGPAGPQPPGAAGAGQAPGQGAAALQLGPAAPGRAAAAVRGYVPAPPAPPPASGRRLRLPCPQLPTPTACWRCTGRCAESPRASAWRGTWPAAPGRPALRRPPPHPSR